jgi:hypothetical protein
VPARGLSDWQPTPHRVDESDELTRSRFCHETWAEIMRTTRSNRSLTPNERIELAHSRMLEDAASIRRENGDFADSFLVVHNTRSNKVLVHQRLATPPTLAEFLLRGALPLRDQRTIPAELAEAFESVVWKYGLPGAKLFYWIQVGSIVRHKGRARLWPWMAVLGAFETLRRIFW